MTHDSVVVVEPIRVRALYAGLAEGASGALSSVHVPFTAFHPIRPMLTTTADQLCLVGDLPSVDGPISTKITIDLTTLKRMCREHPVVFFGRPQLWDLSHPVLAVPHSLLIARTAFGDLVDQYGERIPTEFGLVSFFMATQYGHSSLFVVAPNPDMLAPSAIEEFTDHQSNTYVVPVHETDGTFVEFVLAPTVVSDGIIINDTIISNTSRIALEFFNRTAFPTLTLHELNPVVESSGTVTITSHQIVVECTGKVGYVRIRFDSGPGLLHCNNPQHNTIQYTLQVSDNAGCSTQVCIQARPNSSTTSAS